MFFVELIM